MFDLSGVLPPSKPEYWVNVYYRENTGYWFGNFHPDKWKAKALENKHIVYRIHVRMK